MKTVIGLLDDYSEAERAVVALLDDGLAQAGDISVIARDAVRQTHHKEPELGFELREGAGPDPVKTGAAAGCVAGGGLGGLLGILAGVGAIVLPGIGPAVAAGPLLAAMAGATVGAVTGAVGGALVGELARLGVPELDAHVYAEGVRRGGTLVVVRASDEAADRVADVLTHHGAIDVEERRASFKMTGFTVFSPDATPYTADDILRERELQRASAGPSSPTRGAQILGR